MTKITATALKRALNAAGAERVKRPATSAPSAARHVALKESRRASERMIAEALRGGGLDLKKYKSLQDARSAELQRAVEEHKAQVLRHTSKRRAALRSGALEQSTQLRKLALANGFFPHPSFSLDSPLLIWGIPNTPIYDDAIVPFGSWAKFKFKTSSYEGPQRVGFYFYWTNPYNDTALINAATSFSAAGYIQANASWSLWSHYSLGGANALFNIWLGWPTSETSSSSDFSGLGSANAFSTWLGGETNGTAISAGLSLSPATPFAVPPGGVVFFEVALELTWLIDGGDFQADFQSGDFRIECPVVVLWLLNTPGFLFPHPVFPDPVIKSTA
jgi:hypothetical protein